MDSLRSHDSGMSPQSESDAAYARYDADDRGLERPPSIGVNERRMQVRAYNYWTQLLGEAPYPSIEDLAPETIGDIGEHGVLLDFTSGIENPAVQYLGCAIGEECGLDESIQWLEQVPPRSLLSRITDHYMQILANKAPIGFEAEFVNQRGSTILYRGILLPFSSDGDTIDFIFGVINWKEALPLPDQAALEDEMGAAMAQAPMVQDHVPAWAETNAADELDLAPFTAEAFFDAADADPEIAAMPVMPMVRQATIPAMAAMDGELVDAPEPDADAGLADWLASARVLAEAAAQAESRGRRSLYDAIGRAHDFALRAMSNPAEYRELLADAGIAMQDRAPFTPVAKLVFGVGYDKTRIAEIACALSFAQAQHVQSGQFGDYLAHYDGGLKGLIADYRDARRDTGLLPRPDSALDLRDSLRHVPARDLTEFTGGGAEFVLLVGRRNMHGEVELIGAVDDEKATTRMLKKIKR